MEWFTLVIVFAPYVQYSVSRTLFNSTVALLMLPHLSRLFIVSVLENRLIFNTSWVCKYDVPNIVWKIAQHLSLQPPTYETEGRQYEALTGAWIGPINMYRLMVTFCILGFGLFKAIVLYTGGYTRPLECLIGMAVALGSVGLP